MRDYQGIAVDQEDDPTRRDSFAKIDYFLHDLSKGMGRIQQGQVPDGSGNTIIDNGPLSDIYLVLLGRPGNQVAHGGKVASGSLTLASTLHPTKGLVYFGNAQRTVYDETNERFGIATAAPTAKLHIAVGAPSFVTTVRPQGDSFSGGWVNTTGGTPVAPDVGGTTTATFGRGLESAGFSSYIASATGTAPGTLSGWTVGFSARVLTGPPGLSTLTVNMDSGGSSWFNSGAQPITTGGFQNFTFPVDSTSATAAVFSNLRWGLSYASTPGFGEIQVANLRLELPAAGGVAADVLQRWSTSATANRLDFGDSGASTVDMQMSGDAPMFFNVGDGSSGLRIYTSASTAFLEAGTTGQSAQNLTIGGNRQSQASSFFISAASATAGNIFRAAQIGIGAAPTLSPAIHLDVTGRSRWPWVQYSVTGSTTNHDVGSSTFVLASASAALQQIKGITNGVDGRLLYIINNGSQEITLSHEAAGGTNANKLRCMTGRDITLIVNDAVVAVYDGALSRWRVNKWASPVAPEFIVGAWHFDTPFDVSGSLTVSADMSVSGPRILWMDSNSNFYVQIQAPSAAGAATWTLPDTSDQFVGRNTTDTLAQKTLAISTKARVSSLGSGFRFEDNTTTAKALYLDLQGVTAANHAIVVSGTTASRSWYNLANFDSKFIFGGVSAISSAAATTQGTLAYVSATGVTGNLTTTTLASAVGAGMYRVPWYIKITTIGDAEPTDSLAPACIWNDGTAQSRVLIPDNETAAAVIDGTLPVNTLNRAFSGSIVVSAAASSNIAVSAALVNGGATNPQYTFFATVEAL